MNFYDSDLNSMHQSDFESDNEPPKDILMEKKLVKKYELKRIFKQIVRVYIGLMKVREKYYKTCKI